MDRELRRELSKRKWISRAKKVYNACGKFYVPVAGIKANVRYNVPIIRNKALKVCESITDFLDSSKYAKMLKNCTSPYRSRIGTYTEEKMISSLEKRYAFYKDGIVYQKPHIILEFSKRHDESIYFDSDEEMEGWFESFMEEFGKPFIYID